MYKYRLLGGQNGLYPLEERGTDSIKLVSLGSLIPVLKAHEVINAYWDGVMVVNNLAYVWLTKENGSWYAEFKNEDGSRVHTSHINGWEMGATYTDIKKFAKEQYGLVLPAIDGLRLIKQTRYRKIYEI